MSCAASAWGFMSFLFAETDKRIEAEPRLLESGFVPFFEIRLISGFLQCSPNERKTTLELSSRRVSLGSFRYANHRERYKSQVEQSDLPSEEELARRIDRPTNPEEEVSSRRAIKAHRFSRLKRIHSADERINFLRLGAAGANISGIVAHAESLRKRGFSPQLLQFSSRHGLVSLSRNAISSSEYRRELSLLAGFSRPLIAGLRFSRFSSGDSRKERNRG